MAPRDVVDEPSEEVVAAARKDRANRRGLFARIALFLQQVMSELRKVVTPTRRELISYTLVVLAFVIVVMALVTGFDFGFGWLVAAVFGDVNNYQF